MTVSINILDFPNIDVEVWTQESEFQQGNFLRYLTQPKITRQRPFELTYIDYDRIKNEISGVEYVEYNNSVGRNITNVDYIEDFSNL